MIVQYLVFFLPSLLFSALALTDLQLINAFYFPLMPCASPGLHHPFMFNLRMKNFTSNVSRQPFRAQSVPLYVPILSKAPQQRDIHWGGRECCYMSHHPKCVGGLVWRRCGRKSRWVDRRSHSCSLICSLWLVLWTRTRDWQRTRGRNPLLSDAKKRALKAAARGQLNLTFTGLNCRYWTVPPPPHSCPFHRTFFFKIVGETQWVSVSAVSCPASWAAAGTGIM